MLDLNNTKILGVINRTPNSFSDSGLSLSPTYFREQLSSFLEDPFLIVDVGFESTAPMNKAITIDEEWERFSLFLEASREFNFSHRLISFDTYRPSHFLKMRNAFLKIHPQTQFILNDVSGVLDDSLKECILETRDIGQMYIYTFTHIPSRDKVLDHMTFINESRDVIDQCCEAFKRAQDFYLPLLRHESQLILDPGFGFSKSYEQNWTLIDDFESLSLRLKNLEINHPLLIGVSKKSFLRKFANSTDPVILERLHREVLFKMSQKSQHPLLFRVHDPKVCDFE